jgi:hypothetical protein
MLACIREFLDSCADDVKELLLPDRVQFFYFLVSLDALQA